MSDYGIRVSKEGVDVRTGDDKDMILTNKYPLLKGELSLNGDTTVTSGTPKVLTFPHSLGYIPFSHVYFKDTTAASDRWYLSPFAAGAGAEYLYVSSSANSTNVYVKFDWWRSSGGTNKFYYKCFIYLDKGKL